MASKTKKSLARDSLVETVRANSVLLEQMQGQTQMVLEALTGFKQAMDRRFTELEERLSARIGVLEDVVRKNSEDIRQNSDDIRELQKEVRELRRDFDRRAELARVAELEQRVARCEAKLGIAS